MDQAYIWRMKVNRYAKIRQLEFNGHEASEWIGSVQFVVAHEYIVFFDVHVSYSSCMNLLDSFQNLVIDRKGQCFWEILSKLNHFLQRPVLSVIKDHKGVISLRHLGRVLLVYNQIG